jgi:hypothetical protein
MLGKPETQKFMGANQMLNRLAEQVGSRQKAVDILKARGHLEADGKTWTAAGAKRNAMTAEERAKDRASKESGKPASDFKYNPRTNRASGTGR